MNSPIEIIRRLTTLSEEDEKRLTELMVERRYKRHETITGIRALMPYAFYIKQGSARVYYLRGGRDYTYSFSYDDEYVAISRHLLQAQDDTLSIEFLEPTTVITISPERVKDATRSLNITFNINEALLFMNAAMMHYMLQVEEHLTVILHSRAAERYHWAINRYPRLLETATITQLASFLGLTKETLYRLRSHTPHP